MGKYALENYERYNTYKIRPQPLPMAPDSKGRGQFHKVTLTWKELEPVRGGYNLRELHRLIDDTSNPVLMIKADFPSWVTERASECFASFIRKIGSSLDGNYKLEGIVITTIESCSHEWEAYIDAFGEFPLLVDMHNQELIQYLTIHNMDFGLIVKCSETNWIECCEKLAEYNLQEVWKKRPVLLQIEDSSCGPHIERQAWSWHASMANVPMDLGFSIALRRLTYPKQVSSNGALPLRFWFVNTGSAPCYRDSKVWIRLQQGSNRYDISLRVNTKDWLLGDVTYNEIVKLPEMDPGTYKVSLGIFFEDHSPMQLNMNCTIDHGFYELGSIEIDVVPREEYFHIWDEYYPEGYYPLEDPQSPEEG